MVGITVLLLVKEWGGGEAGQTSLPLPPHSHLLHPLHPT